MSRSVFKHAWIVWTFTLVLNWVSFLWIGFRARSLAWTAAGVMYAFPLVMLMVSSSTTSKPGYSGLSRTDGLAVGLLMCGALISIVHALLIRSDYQARLSQRRDRDTGTSGVGVVQRLRALRWRAKGPLLGALSVLALMTVVLALQDGRKLAPPKSPHVAAAEPAETATPVAARTNPAAATGAAKPATATGTAKSATATETPQRASATPTTVPATTTPSATPTAVPTLGLAQRAEKSIRDNKNASADNANQDNLAVSFDADNKSLRVTIKPNKPSSDTGLMSNGSALAVSAGRAVWTTYAEVNFITIAVEKDIAGNSAPTTMVAALYTRATFGAQDYGQYKKTTGDDNKTMLCMADFYSLDRALWKSLGDKGCMLSSDGGVNAGAAGKTYVIQTSSGPIGIKSQRQSDLLGFLVDFRIYFDLLERNSSAFKEATDAFAADSVTLLSYYNFVVGAGNAFASISKSAQRFDAPPGLDSTVNAVATSADKKSTAMSHLAAFLNKHDLEEQRKALDDLSVANSAQAASAVFLFDQFTKAGLRSDIALALVSCDQTTQKCSLRAPSNPADLFLP